MSQDERQLDLLATFHWVVAGITGLFALLPTLHIGLAWMMLKSPEKFRFPAQNGMQPPQFPAFFPYVIMCFAGAVILFGLALAICIGLSGKYLKSRKKYSFSFVVACIECIFMPFGTVLGIFTIIVLSRESVKNLYGTATNQV